MLLEDSGAEWDEPTASAEFPECVKLWKSQPPTQFPAFAFPFVKMPDGLVLSQTSAILAHVGRKLGYGLDSDEQDALAMQVVLTVQDLFVEGRNCFHGVKWFVSSMSFEEHCSCPACA